MAASRVHVVRPGDCLASLAARYGFGDVRALREHPANAELLERRASHHILAPGDIVHIPAQGARGAPLRSGAVNHYAARIPCVPLRVRLHDPDGSAIAGARYELVVGPQRFTGDTGPDGVVEQDVDATATEGLLRLFDADGTTVVSTLTLAIGHLDPADTPSGVRARLKNLGLLSLGGEDEAIRALQSEEGLAETGEIDDATRTALVSRHGC